MNKKQYAACPIICLVNDQLDIYIYIYMSGKVKKKWQLCILQNQMKISIGVEWSTWDCLKGLLESQLDGYEPLL